MDIKKSIVEVVAAIFLFTLLSTILEREYTQEIILLKLQTGVIFGLVYALFIWVREKFRNKKNVK